MNSGVLGIDIGGANLKYATGQGLWLDRPFPIWTHAATLAAQLTADVARFEGIERLAVTMTGELADCFAGRAAGVRYIVDQVVGGLPDMALEDALFYGTDGRFHDADSAKRNWESIAASNWHALARAVGQRIAAEALLIDVGSTTTDVIAIRGGEVLTTAATDFERLCDDSLVYIGCRRTPVCALVSQLELRGRQVPVMREVFATIDDARLLIGVQAEAPEDRETADSQPRDRRHAAARIARMIGLDREQVTAQEVDDLARQIHAAAVGRISHAVQKWWASLHVEPGPAAVCVLSGHGQDVVHPPAGARLIDLREELSSGLSRVAPAWAVVALAVESGGGSTA